MVKLKVVYTWYDEFWGAWKEEDAGYLEGSEVVITNANFCPTGKYDITKINWQHGRDPGFVITAKRLEEV